MLFLALKKGQMVKITPQILSLDKKIPSKQNFLFQPHWGEFPLSVKGDSMEKWTWGPKKKIFVIDFIFTYIIPYAHL